MRSTYEIRARNPADFTLIEEEHDDEAMAHKAASSLYNNGYDVTVTYISRTRIAEWKQED